MVETREWCRENWVLTTDRRRLQLAVIHGFLGRSYWAPGIPREVVERSIENSLCFGIYDRGKGERQVGFARVVTDYATFAWVSDVFVVEEARGRGLGAWLMETIASHPDLQGLRRWVLATRDAHGLYEKVGFQRLAEPGQFMERKTLPRVTSSR